MSTKHFANGTEGQAWMACWCTYCEHDHAQHTGGDGGCDLILAALLGDNEDNADAWVAEPDDSKFFLPSRMVCLKFKPCLNDGCTGDPGAEDRAVRITEVTSWWREHRSVR